MPSSDEDQIFTNEEIRDTVNHNSANSISGVYQAKTIFIKNDLNQQVTFQLQGARNGTWINIGSSFDIAASINDYKTVTDYFPKYRLQASCTTAPTTGNLDVWMLKSRG